ncbi:MAG TPA: methyltransferase domain-containing protein, partial [Dongiaceae bacterium]|nr:methyltransferase domain-containing protein [Dongiaceae bacterium]
YAHPRLAATYDAINPPEGDYDFYVALAGEQPRTILDMGSGTGRLSLKLAARGHRVTGADPAPGMMLAARAKPDADKVTWVLSDATSLNLGTRFDLIIMTGHVFQVFLSDDEVRAVLDNLRRHLAPGGRIAFETRNPAVREWESWTPELTREQVAVPDIGPVTVHYAVTAEDARSITFETHFDFGGGDVVVTPTSLRLMDQVTLKRLLKESGLKPWDWYGSWDRAPLSPDSPEIIVVAGAA